MIRTEVDGPIVTLTLDRPEKMNSLSPAMFSELARFWPEFEADESLHVAIVTGTGRAFSSGRDLVRTNAAQDERERYDGADPDAPFAIDQISKPVIAAINGWCLAAGFALALACDLRIISEGARIGSVAPRRGLLSAAGQAQRLVRYVPFGLALELLLRGNHIDAHEAHRIGLVNAVVPPDQLQSTARAWAEEIASNAPLSVRYNKRAAYEGGLSSNGAFQRGLEIEAGLYRKILRTEDMQEGVRAFMEGRAPVYKGR
ncbi:MAG: enoyl-CoA hydratase-related protein [Chloroflexi bacterium]|nr:enoyl-CoA hydratase-related protein [Chloroflexota bacterium]